MRKTSPSNKSLGTYEGAQDSRIHPLFHWVRFQGQIIPLKVLKICETPPSRQGNEISNSAKPEVENERKIDGARCKAAKSAHPYLGCRGLWEMFFGDIWNVSLNSKHIFSYSFGNCFSQAFEHATCPIFASFGNVFPEEIYTWCWHYFVAKESTRWRCSSSLLRLEHGSGRMAIRLLKYLSFQNITKFPNLVDTLMPEGTKVPNAL